MDEKEVYETTILTEDGCCNLTDEVYTLEYFNQFVRKDCKQYRMSHLMNLLLFIKHNNITNLWTCLSAITSADKYEWLCLILDGGLEFGVICAFIQSMYQQEQDKNQKGFLC